MDTSTSIARVVVDVPTRALTEPFAYAVPDELSSRLVVGYPVAVPLGGRRCVGYVVELAASTEYQSKLRAVDAVLGDPLFDEHALGLARWIADTYLAPLSESLKLFLPPGGAPKVVQTESGWTYQGAQLRAASVRLVTRVEGSSYVPSRRATAQRDGLAALAEGPVTLSEL